MANVAHFYCVCVRWQWVGGGTVKVENGSNDLYSIPLKEVFSDAPRAALYKIEAPRRLRSQWRSRLENTQACEGGDAGADAARRSRPSLLAYLETLVC